MKKTSRKTQRASPKRVKLPAGRRSSPKRSSSRRGKKEEIKFDSKKIQETVKEVQSELFHAKNKKDVEQALAKLPPVPILEETPMVQKAAKEFVKRTSSHKSTKTEEQIKEILSSSLSPEEMLEQIQFASGKKPSPDSKRWIIRMIDMTKKLGKNVTDLTPYILGLLATGAAGYFGFYYAIPYLASLMPSVETLQNMKLMFFGYGPILPMGYGNPLQGLLGQVGLNKPTVVPTPTPGIALPYEQPKLAFGMTPGSHVGQTLPTDILRIKPEYGKKNIEFLRQAVLNPVPSSDGSDFLSRTYPIILSAQALGREGSIQPDILNNVEYSKQASRYFREHGLTSDRAVENYIRTHEPGTVGYDPQKWFEFKKYWYLVEHRTFSNVAEFIQMFS